MFNYVPLETWTAEELAKTRKWDSENSLAIAGMTRNGEPFRLGTIVKSLGFRISSTNVRKLLQNRPGFVEVMNPDGSSSGWWFYHPEVIEYAAARGFVYPPILTYFAGSNIPKRVLADKDSFTESLLPIPENLAAAPKTEPVMVPVPAEFMANRVESSSPVEKVQAKTETYPTYTDNYLSVRVSKKKRDTTPQEVVAEIKDLASKIGRDRAALDKLAVLVTSVLYTTREVEKRKK